MGGKGSGRKTIYPIPQPQHTNYYMAWQKFLKSDEYARLVRSLSHYGVRQPFIDNIIRGGFDAGWNATGTKIEIIDTQPKTEGG